ncbi:MAG: DUF4910 domain-containing protein [Erysipelotrichaceae bacterium]|nr:DUF4910 domain-containing protein [Erysipelotrichaceae bacterium]
MKQLNELLKQTIDEKRLYTGVKEVSSYHRIQASTGFRAAANYCKSALDKMGIQSSIISYEAKPEVWYLQNKMFMEWDLKDAWLKLENPEMLLCDAQAEPISVIQKSYPVDFTEGAELVYLSEGNHPEKYADVDLKGKIVFVRDAFNGYVDWAIKEKGAIGIVTDFMRTVPGIRSRNDLYESLNYTSFWWTHAEDEPKTFGFVLSPKMGDVLADLCLKQKAAYEKQEKDSPYLKVTGKVDTSLYPGAIEVVEAVLPGETDEEVLISAHLCHPKCSCNDNASGVSASMEVLRALKHLMETGKIAKNKRTIKVILIPEFTGTYAYLSDHNEYKKVIGAINLDMVGGKQTRFYGPITLTALPYSTPSFINDLSSLCLDYAAEEVPNLSGKLVAKTNHTFESFSGGSDHTVFSDPTIGVPCCMLGQWPDLNYHTATDTLDVIDPEVLAFSCRTAALYAYTLSNLTLENVKEIQNKAHVNLAAKLAEVANLFNEGKVNAKEADAQLNHVENFYVKSAEDLKRVIQLEDEYVEKETAWAKSAVHQMKVYLNTEPEELKIVDGRVFVRDYAGPIHSLTDCAALHPEVKPLMDAYHQATAHMGFGAYSLETLMQYYIDGKNTVSEIAHKVECDTLTECLEITQKFVELLEGMKLVHQK